MSRSQKPWQGLPSVGRTVLIACLQEGHTDRLRDWFTRAGWSFVSAIDRDAVIRALATRSFDIVITDRSLMLPQIEEILDHVRKDEGSPSFLVVEQAETGATSSHNHQVLNDTSLEIDLEAFVNVEIYGAPVEGEPTKLFYSPFRQELDSSVALLQRPILPILEQLFQRKVLDYSERLRLELAYQEALTNALEHGNLELDSGLKEQFDEQGKDRYSLLRAERIQLQPYSNRQIIIEASFQNDVLVIRITDQGLGFDVETVLKQKREREQLSGRGLEIIHEVMDEVRFSENGRCIEMIREFRRP